MHAAVEIGGRWYDCDFSYPHTGPQLENASGDWERSPYSRYNARLELTCFPPPKVRPGLYQVKTAAGIVDFDAESPKVAVIWGTVRDGT
jgi:hypothetical protein